MAEKSNIEQSLQTLIDLSAMSRKANEAGFDRLTGAIEHLTLNIGLLGSQQKATANNLDRLGEKIDQLTDRLGDRIDRLATAIERQNQAIDGHLRLSEAQAANIAELTRLATRLVDQRSVS